MRNGPEAGLHKERLRVGYHTELFDIGKTKLEVPAVAEALLAVIAGQ